MPSKTEWQCAGALLEKARVADLDFHELKTTNSVLLSLEAWEKEIGKGLCDIARLSGIAFERAQKDIFHLI